MRKHLLSLLICTATASAGLLGCREKPEPSEPIPVATPIPLNQFVRAWSSVLDLPAGDQVKAIHPRGDTLFVYTKSGQILSMVAASGKVTWAQQIRETDRGGMKPPVVQKERIVVPTSSTLELFEPTEGQLLRSIPLQIAARSNAVGYENLVFLGGDNEKGGGRVIALDVTRPYVPKIWELMVLKGGLASTPAIFEDVLFVGGGDGNVYAVAAINREPLWGLRDSAFKTEGPIVGDVVVDETGVYVASTDSRFYCLNRGTGRLKWQFYGGTALIDDPILTPTAVYLPINAAGMAMFDKGDGEFNRKPRWIVPGMTQFLVEDERMVYLLRGTDKAIVAVDKATGEVRFTSNRRDLVSFATNLKADGVIYAASNTNRVMAIKPVLRAGVVGELVFHEIPMDAAQTPVFGG